MRRWKEKFIKIYEYCIIEDNYVHFLMVEVVIYEDFKHEKWRKWNFELLRIFRMNKNHLMQEIQPRNTRGWIFSITITVHKAFWYFSKKFPLNKFVGIYKEDS